MDAGVERKPVDERDFAARAPARSAQRAPLSTSKRPAGRRLGLRKGLRLRFWLRQRIGEGRNSRGKLPLLAQGRRPGSCQPRATPWVSGSPNTGRAEGPRHLNPRAIEIARYIAMSISERGSWPYASKAVTASRVSPVGRRELRTEAAMSHRPGRWAPAATSRTPSPFPGTPSSSSAFEALEAAETADLVLDAPR